MARIDLKKELKHLYAPSAKVPAIVEVPPMNFLMADGSGGPHTAPEFKAAVEALFSLSFTMKFELKKGGPPADDYTVMPLEGLWWVDQMRQFNLGEKDLWQWTLMIMQPECVTAELFARALKELAKKKACPALAKARLEEFDEGLAAQIMHIGPYSAEEPTITRLRALIKEEGYSLRGKHHEIYLGDPRRCAPEKLRTILRQPIELGAAA